MSIKKTLLMLTLNYIIIFAWMFWFRLGEISALIIFPITMGIAFLDTVFAEGRLSAYLWCFNLLIASIAGILLQAYLCVRNAESSEAVFSRVVIEIPVAILIIAIVALISGHEAARLEKRRRRKPVNIGTGGRTVHRARVPYGQDRYAEDYPDISDEDIMDDTGDDVAEDHEEDEDHEPLMRVIKKSGQ